MVSRSQQMSPDPEEILHHAMDGGEALEMGGRFETPHLAFALPRRLMREPCPVVGVLLRAVHDGRHHGSVGGRVAAQLVGDQPTGEPALFLQQRAEESHRGAPIPPRLDQDVQHIAIFVHRSPEVLLAAVQGHEEFIEVPGVPLGRQVWGPRRRRNVRA